MKIIGCDFHTRDQQIAMMDEATGELTERRLDHESGEAQAFYRELQGPVRVGIEATGPVRWFERLLGELGHELWIGGWASLCGGFELPGGRSLAVFEGSVGLMFPFKIVALGTVQKSKPRPSKSGRVGHPEEQLLRKGAREITSRITYTTGIIQSEKAVN